MNTAVRWVASILLMIGVASSTYIVVYYLSNYAVSQLHMPLSLGIWASAWPPPCKWCCRRLLAERPPGPPSGGAVVARGIAADDLSRLCADQCRAPA
ncbi:hypothetical protein ACU4GD_29495 [Cupriavidus basilensis]